MTLGSVTNFPLICRIVWSQVLCKDRSRDCDIENMLSKKGVPCLTASVAKPRSVEMYSKAPLTTLPEQPKTSTLRIQNHILLWLSCYAGNSDEISLLSTIMWSTPSVPTPIFNKTCKHTKQTSRSDLNHYIVPSQLKNHHTTTVRCGEFPATSLNRSGFNGFKDFTFFCCWVQELGAL